MDLITQGLLGATIGQAFFNKPLGRKAVWAGAAAGMLPDLDMVGVYLGGPMAELKYHRWITHSFWFGAVTAFVLAWLIVKLQRSGKPQPTFKTWFWLLFWAIFTHPLLDLFTVYGTQFYAPFSSTRIHWHAIAIIDLGYSLLLVGALVAGSLWDRKQKWQRSARFAQLMLIASTLYLFMGLGADYYLTKIAQDMKPEHTIRTHPTFLQPFYRKIYAYGPEEICYSTYTFLKPRPLIFQCKPQQPHPAFANFLNSESGKLFLWFADQEIRMEYIEGNPTVVRLHDLRFTHPNAPFEGMWGLEAAVDTKGNLLEEPRRFRMKRPSVRQMWNAILPAATGFQP